MMFNRRFFMALLALALLLRSAAGLAMQIDMAYGMMHAAAPMATTQVVPPCHEAMQGAEASASNAADASHCSLCCMAVALQSTTVFTFLPIEYPAPITALFLSLPAPAQRPTKPPLV